MAGSRGRDLEIKILSDMDDFDTGRAADDLDDLGKSAKEMGDDVEDATKDVDDAFEKVGDSAKAMESDVGKAADGLDSEMEKAGRAVKGLDDDVDQTAKKVDAAFDKIARSSKSSLSKVDDDARKAGKGMDDFKGEVDSTGREAAASFSGSMEDISDSLQEVSANALAAFGPAGAIVGIAAAAALGTIVSSLQEAADAANEATEETAGLAREIVDAGGALDQVDFEGRFRDWSLEIADNVRWWEVWQDEATTNIEEVDRALADATVTSDAFLAAMASDSPKVMEDVLADLRGEVEALKQAEEDYLEQNPYAETVNGAKVQGYRDQRAGLEDLIATGEDHQEQQERGIALAQRVMETEIEADWARQQASENFGNYRHEVKATNEELELSQGLYDALDSELDGHAAVVEEAARREAVANGDKASSWEEYKDAAVVSIADINAVLESQIQAHADFTANLQQLNQAQIDAAYGIADEMNIPVQQVVQMMVDAPMDARGELVANWNQVGGEGADAMVSSTAQGMAAGRATVRGEAVRIYDDVEGVLSQDITMPTKVSTVSPSDVAWVRQQARNALGTITIPTRLGRPTGSATARNWE